MNPRVLLGALTGSLLSHGLAALPLEEVRVTAQKRNQDILEVPLSLTVYSGSAMQRGAIFDLSDLAANTPNLSANDESNSVYIRGIGTPELNPVSEQAVSYTIDGVHVPRLSYLAAGFLDVDRLEVLKGPQGTLFGRNASAGVIKIDSALPGEIWSGKINARSGKHQSHGLEAAISGPLSQRLSVRLAAKRETEDGSTKSIPSRDTLGDRTQEMQRFTLRYEADSNFDTTLRYTWLNYFHGVFVGYEFHAYPDDLRLALAEPLDPNFETRLDRRSSLPRNKGDRYESRAYGRAHVVPLEINWRQWGHSFTSVTGYAEIDTFLGGDTDYLAAEIIGDETFLDDRQFSQELRVSRELDKWRYSAGLYYFRNTTDVHYEIPIFADFVSAAAGLGILPLDSLLTFITGEEQQVLDNLLVGFEIDTKAWGIFGELSWQPLDQLTLTLGGRQSREDKHALIHVNNTGPAPIWNAISESPYSANRQISENNFSPKAVLSWEAGESHTFYASYTEGFRSGSFNAAATQSSFLTFDSENAANIEIGMKSVLLSNRVRLNLTAFNTQYRGYQLSAFTGSSYVISNAPKVEMQGAELDFSIHALPGLRLSAALGYNDARFVKHPNGACPTESISDALARYPTASPLAARSDCNLSGKQLHRAPLWNGNFGMDFRLPLQPFGLPWELHIGASANYRDDEFFDADRDPIDSQKAYWLYNAKLGLSDSRNRWQLSLHGINLSNELVKTFSGDVSLQPGAHIAATNHQRQVLLSLGLYF